MTSSHVRLYVILARAAPVGVIFRRGPSKSVLLIRWNLTEDTFQTGQWFKGRIYERRCDLSPEGKLLLYFAAKYREPLYSWTAISRPPFLTALAVWPKGDGWGGGGHFLTSTKIALNHREAEFSLADGSSLPRRFAVRPFGQRPGWGEDEPIWSERLKRDGWKLVDYPTQTKDEWGGKVWMEFSPPIRWRKENPKWPRKYSVDMLILGVHERDGAWYLIEHCINRNPRTQDNLGRTEWADWSSNGDLLFAMNGSLYRVPCAHGVLAPLEDAIQLADFSALRFEERAAPAEALEWPAR